ncbi:ACT domain-containing protein [Defluviimonas aestuarii]|uniref:ACT domain-containing protein n=1 Tax=Albidovulum aestuarii TaxID=1130726 RepID=UPI00249A823F|nr:ACT domain-containing protein [Defluviimonas aestuarii]MDI3335342.1 ACT domain-containing protein [Defluviimonas aestuarii]
MPVISHTAKDMIGNMAPLLRDGEYVFVSTPDEALGQALAPKAIATHREDEGLSLILPASIAQGAGFDAGNPMRCITLKVYSALDGVGLTAAVADALAGQGIPCNMVAAFHHDHVFVPSDRADEAMQILIALQQEVAGG